MRKRYNKTKRYRKTKGYRKNKYNRKKKKNMKGGNMETIGRAALVGASAPVILGTTAMGTVGLAAAASAGNVVKQASKNHLCECNGLYFGRACRGCKKPSSLTPFCPGTQNCCRGRFQNMFFQEPLINTNIFDDEYLNHYVCKECLRSEKDIMLNIVLERNAYLQPEAKLKDDYEEVCWMLSRDKDIPGRPYYLDQNDKEYLRNSLNDINYSIFLADTRAPRLRRPVQRLA